METSLESKFLETNQLKEEVRTQSSVPSSAKKFRLVSLPIK